VTTGVILDCDTGIDDALAIAYAAGAGVPLVACTVVHGNVPVEVGSRNTVTVLDAVGLAHVPVHSGASRPMAQDLLTAEHVHGQDGLGDAGIEASSRAVAGDLAAVRIVELARANPGQLTLVAVGPLTNVALALLLEPQLPQLVTRVVVMGGAVGAVGNASETGEANIWHDPEAAQIVIDAPWDVVFVGLEATMRTPLSQEQLARIERSDDPRARLCWRVLQHYLDVYETVLGERSCVLHDPLALVLAIEPDLATYRTVRAFVELGRGGTRGMLVGDLRGFRPDPDDPRAPGVIRIVDTLDTAAFHERFLSAIGA
jgi:purine nucleosidase